MAILANILLVVNVFVCIALIAVVLLQRSEGGALGVGGGGGPSGFMTARGAGDLLTRITWILAGVFFVLAMAQTLLVGRAHGHGSIVDRINVQSLDLSTPQQSPSSAPPATAPQGPQAPLPTLQQPTAPASNKAADSLSILAAPSAPAPQPQVPAPAKPEPAKP